MDGCSHIASATRIAGLDLEFLKCVSRGAARGALGEGPDWAAQGRRGPGQPGHQWAPASGPSTSEGEWHCVECGTGLSPWICLGCGLVHCGRYVNQDGLRHFQRHPEHPVCMDLASFDLFCYSCDDYVAANPFLHQQLASIQDSVTAHCEVRAWDHAYSQPSLLLNAALPLPLHGVLRGGHEHPPLLLPQLPHPRLAAPAALSSLGGPRPGGARRPGFRGLKTAGNVNPVPAPRKPHIISNLDTVKKVARGGGKGRGKRKVLEPKTENKTPDAKGRRVQLQAEELVLGIRGLRNLGNTCFLNSVVQSLNNLPLFSEELRGLAEVGESETAVAGAAVRTRRSVGETVSLSAELRKTLLGLAEAGSGAVSPDALFSVVWKLVPRFRGFQQQDAHEFLRCLLERLSSELGPSQGLVARHFQGLLASRLTCRICRHSSWKHDPFMDLSLDIPLPPAGSSAASAAAPISLSDCLARFFAPEDLEGREQAQCDHCHAKTPTTKQFFLRRLPNVLCLHLKRFRWQFGRQKLDHFVHFPMEQPGLSLKPFLLPEDSKSEGGSESGATTVTPSPSVARLLEEPAAGESTPSASSASEFRLAAVVVHHGCGAGSGHYTAYGHRLAGKGAAERAAGDWFHFNDASVRRSNTDIVRQQKAYLLFYVRLAPDLHLRPPSPVPV